MCLRISRIRWKKIVFQWLSSQLIFKGKFYFAWKVIFFGMIWSRLIWQTNFYFVFFSVLHALRPIYGIIYYKSLRRRFHRRVAFPFFLSPSRLLRKGSLWLAKSVNKGIESLNKNLIFECFGICSEKKTLATKKKAEYYKNGAMYYKKKNFKW